MRDLNVITMMQLQEEFSKDIRDIRNRENTPEERQMVIEEAKMISSHGKQMINVVNACMNYEKMNAQKRDFHDSMLNQLIGY